MTTPVNKLADSLMYFVLSVVLYFVVMVFTSCKKDENNPPTETTKGLPAKTSLVEFEAKANQIEARLMDRFLENGYVVDRDSRDERAVGYGDAMLFTGIAIGVLPCDKAKILYDKVHESIEKQDGAIIRIDPLPASHSDNASSRDMVVGAIFGFPQYYRRCKDERVPQDFKKHIDYVNSLDKLHRDCDSRCNLTIPFRYAWEHAGWQLGVYNKPSIVNRAGFHTGTLANWEAISNLKQACYPVHLSTLELIGFALAGDTIGSATRLTYCSISKSMDLPLTDWYCEQGDINKWLRDYEVGKLQYQHQRCPRWEDNTLHEFEVSNGVDFLLLYYLAKE